MIKTVNTEAHTNEHNMHACMYIQDELVVSWILTFHQPYRTTHKTKTINEQGRVDDMNTRMEKAAKVERASMIRGWRTDKRCDIKGMKVSEVLASDHCRC